MPTKVLFTTLLDTSTVVFATTATARSPDETATPNFSHVITNLPGKSLVAVEMAYPPGGAPEPHGHARSAFVYGYVISGAIVSEIDDGPAQIYTAGQTFYEAPGAHRRVSRNASKSVPAKLIAVFIVDASATTAPTDETSASGQ